MIRSVRSFALGLALGSTVLAVKHYIGETPARWYAVALFLAVLAAWLLSSTRTSTFGYWVTRGTDSEDGLPCWLVKGGPFSEPDDTVAELPTWREARRYIRTSQGMARQLIRDQRARQRAHG
ncbi:hypothetical protein [Streptomyces rubiginosohelvolus]|uniref:hypothetical protein n=1 Tax=Streptomyces rubiginosohelvolus TaxID=67362 RepID=UPI0035DA4210